jgi:hypothetical protein
MTISGLGSGLQRRIAEGKADPISDLERAQLQELRAIYKERFGEYPKARVGKLPRATKARKVGKTT